MYMQEIIHCYHVEQTADIGKQDTSSLNAYIQLARQLCQSLASRCRHSKHILPHRVQVQLQQQPQQLHS